MLARTLRRVPAIVVIAAAIVACSPAAVPGTQSPGPDGDLDATVTPVAATATPTAVPSPTTATETPAPTATPIDAHVVLRLDRSDDIGEPALPPLSIYGDGTVLWPDVRSGDSLVARLDPADLPDLLADVRRDAELDAGDIGMDPAHQDAGFSSWMITLRVDDALVKRVVVNPPAPARQAEADRFFALIERLQDPAAWDLEATWLVEPGAAARWVPAQYRLETLLIEGPDSASREVDVADIPWPLPGELMEFGEVNPDLDERGVLHCGLVPLVVALDIEAAFGGQGLPRAFHSGYLDLTWTARNSHGTLWLVAVVPDAPTGCPLPG